MPDYAIVGYTLRTPAHSFGRSDVRPNNIAGCSEETNAEMMALCELPAHDQLYINVNHGAFQRNGAGLAKHKDLSRFSEIECLVPATVLFRNQTSISQHLSVMKSIGGAV